MISQHHRVRNRPESAVLVSRKHQTSTMHSITVKASMPKRRWVYSSVGALVCAISALLLIVISESTRLNEAILPLLFVIVVVPVAVRFGNLAGACGTVLATLIFASFFRPRWSLAISDPTATKHLIEMLVLGIVLSDLFGAYSLPQTRTTDRR
jgi:K+-sensing histidine kinase KdpD